MTDQRSTFTDPTVPPPLPKAARASGIDAYATGKNLFRVGLGLVLAALAFLFRYGWQQGWITPVAQVGAGALASMAFVVIGDRLRGRRDVFGHMLQGGGVAGLYLTAFAAHAAFAMTEPTAAFVQLIAVAALGVGLALRRDSIPLASISIVGGLTAPFLIPGTISGGAGDVVYLGVVLGAGVVLSLVRGWWPLYAVAAAGATVTGALVAAGWRMGSAGDLPGVTYGFVIYIVLVLAPVGWMLKEGFGDQVIVAGSAAMALVAGALVAIQADFATIVATGLALSAAALHATVVRMAGEAGEMHVVPAFGFAAMAAVAAFDGPLVLLSLAAASAVVALVGRRVDTSWIAAAGASAYLLVGLVTIDQSGSAAAAGVGGVVARFGVFAIAALVAALEHRGGADPTEVRAVGLVSFGGWMVLAFTELAPVNLALVTAIWAVLGMALVVVGHIGSERSLLVTGLATLGLTLAKLFFVDLATVEPVWRIGLFAGLGMMLLAVGYWMGRDDA